MSPMRILRLLVGGVMLMPMLYIAFVTLAPPVATAALDTYMSSQIGVLTRADFEVGAAYKPGERSQLLDACKAEFRRNADASKDEIKKLGIVPQPEKLAALCECIADSAISAMSRYDRLIMQSHMTENTLQTDYLETRALRIGLSDAERSTAGQWGSGVNQVTRRCTERMRQL